MYCLDYELAIQGNDMYNISKKDKSELSFFCMCFFF